MTYSTDPPNPLRYQTFLAKCTSPFGTRCLLTREILSRHRKAEALRWVHVCAGIAGGSGRVYERHHAEAETDEGRTEMWTEHVRLPRIQAYSKEKKPAIQPITIPPMSWYVAFCSYRIMKSAAISMTSTWPLVKTEES